MTSIISASFSPTLCFDRLSNQLRQVLRQAQYDTQHKKGSESDFFENEVLSILAQEFDLGDFYVKKKENFFQQYFSTSKHKNPQCLKRGQKFNIEAQLTFPRKSRLKDEINNGDFLRRNLLFLVKRSRLDFFVTFCVKTKSKRETKMFFCIGDFDKLNHHRQAQSPSTSSITKQKITKFQVLTSKYYYHLGVIGVKKKSDSFSPTLCFDRLSNQLRQVLRQAQYDIQHKKGSESDFHRSLLHHYLVAL
ncbi:hypothetical protein Q73A0000_09750 [Kaistella flava (ex Peng et al. 2021)]|uniref:Uncharacterized protein n=1 Tax=Kaistella flava (ex Peng et al. 2021) TaxID=2038776 RepID=A0A7M2Y8Q6_9FLAO|nr:hypothetical protein [Kaistella flava (ex Peng et al. 2021)]QOW10637.1 hypothetical protein Q73A0000_09750 [Kaistella flava (ex Peng et al. 2021)]